jgi:hypothetical protein
MDKPCANIGFSLALHLDSFPAGPVMWQYWPLKGPAQHSDFLFYIRDPNSQYLNVMELILSQQSIRTQEILLAFYPSVQKN